MSALSLLHQDGKWLSFDGDQVRHLDARPKVERSTVVITDFDGAVSQVTSLEGSTAHAVALIEKRLRSDGLIDNESKILIHQTRTVGNGYQALFTAVPLDRWQQMFAWAESQPDHCLLVPSVALLWRTLKPGRGVVLHSGRQFVFVAALRNSMVHASALAFSDSQDDLAMTVAALAERAGKDLAGSDDALDALTVEWIGTLTRAPEGGDAARRSSSVPAHASIRPRPALAAVRRDPVVERWAEPAIDDVPTERTSAPLRAGTADDGMTFDGQGDYANGAVDAAANSAEGAADMAAEPALASPARTEQLHAVPASSNGWSDEALLEIFSANSGTSVRLAPHVLVTDENGVVYRSGVARLAESATAMVAVNPAASRAMFLAERLLPWASAASVVLAIALGGLGGRWTLAAHDARGRAEGLDSEVAAMDASIASLQQAQVLPESYPALLSFIERAGGLQRALDPHAALSTVREAAADDVRILRLRLDQAPAPGTPAVQSLRVDGVVNHDLPGGDQGMQVARFVERLRAAGYVPVAVDPQSGSSRAQAPGGSFSYQLTRAGTGPDGGSAPAPPTPPISAPADAAPGYSGPTAATPGYAGESAS